jgi:dinuclear metal center YbgI/SA1388 family protein
MKLQELVTYLDDYLRVKQIKDSAVNGLQVEGPAEVTRVALAVDARLAAFTEAAACGAQLLIVHHGLFWTTAQTLTGPHYRRVRALIEGNVALYAAHLPLDAHPEIGNSAELARVLGLRRRVPAGDYHGELIGIGGALPKPMALDALAARLAAATGCPPVRVVNGGKPARRVACVSGGAADMARQFAAAGYDTYVTGEVSHGSLPVIEELGINVIFGGHYATETLGLKALAKHLQTRFKLATHFIALPTGA